MSEIQVRQLSGSTGLRWMVRGWQQMNQSLGMWMLVSLAFIGVQILASVVLLFIPLLGPLVHNFLVHPALMLGFFYCAAVVFQTQSVPEAENLFFGFRNVKRFFRIAGAYVIWLLMGILIFGLLLGLFVGILWALNPDFFTTVAAMPHDASQQTDPGKAFTDLTSHVSLGQMVVMAVLLVVFFIVAALFQHGQLYSLYFASLGHADLAQAIALGVRGCTSNARPILVFAVLFGMAGMAVIVLGAVIFALLAWMGIKGLIVGMALMAIPLVVVLSLIFMAWATCAAYAGCQEIFEGGDITEETVQL